MGGNFEDKDIQEMSAEKLYEIVSKGWNSFSERYKLDLGESPAVAKFYINNERLRALMENHKEGDREINSYTTGDLDIFPNTKSSDALSSMKSDITNGHTHYNQDQHVIIFDMSHPYTLRYESSHLVTLFEYEEAITRSVVEAASYKIKACKDYQLAAKDVADVKYAHEHIGDLLVRVEEKVKKELRTSIFNSTFIQVEMLLNDQGLFSTNPRKDFLPRTTIEYVVAGLQQDDSSEFHIQDYNILMGQLPAIAAQKDNMMNSLKGIPMNDFIHMEPEEAWKEFLHPLLIK